MTADGHPIVRRDAAAALGQLGNPAVAPALERLLAAEREEQAQVGLLEALYWLGQRSRLSPLLTLLESHDECVRHAVVNSLAAILLPEDCPLAGPAIMMLLRREENRGSAPTRSGCCKDRPGRGIHNTSGETPRPRASPQHRLPRPVAVAGGWPVRRAGTAHSRKTRDGAPPAAGDERAPTPAGDAARLPAAHPAKRGARRDSSARHRPGAEPWSTWTCGTRGSGDPISTLTLLRQAGG